LLASGHLLDSYLEKNQKHKKDYSSILQKLYKCMSFRLGRIYLKIPQSKSHKRIFLKKVVNGHWLTKLKQDTKARKGQQKTAYREGQKHNSLKISLCTQVLAQSKPGDKT
jgi:hypothetical protein